MADEEDRQEAEELTEDYCRRMDENDKDRSREEESPQDTLFKKIWDDIEDLRRINKENQRVRDLREEMKGMSEEHGVPR